MVYINKFVIELVCGTFLPALLFCSGVFLFFRIGKYFLSLKNIRKSFQKSNDNAKRKNGSAFSSLCLALAGTLGVGNITGVASAIMIGGPGCVFWLWVCGIASSILKFAETLLAFRYREKFSDGTLHGGGFYYIKNGLKSKKFATLFSVTCIISSFFTGNMAQVRSASDGIRMCFNTSPIIIATVFALSVFIITLFGSRYIEKFTSFAVPILCVIYICMSGYVIFVKRDAIPEITKIILRDAFTPRAGLGSIFGVLSSKAVRYGICRGIMSNEAGCGTAPIAHAGATESNGVRQGYMGVIEVFCDTILLCTLTAYAVLLSGAVPNGSACSFAIISFETVLGESARYLLGFSMFFFALAAVAGWSHYGNESLLTLGVKKHSRAAYCIVFSLSAFLGVFLPEKFIWDMSDLTISLMAIINLTAIILLESKCSNELKNFT